MKLEATYAGLSRDGRGNHVLEDVTGDIVRTHHYVNGEYGNWPEGVPIGARVTFFASPHDRRGGRRITDVRDLKVIALKEEERIAEHIHPAIHIEDFRKPTIYIQISPAVLAQIIAEREE